MGKFKPLFDNMIGWVTDDFVKGLLIAEYNRLCECKESSDNSGDCSNPDVKDSLPIPKYCGQCGEPLSRRHKFWCILSGNNRYRFRALRSLGISSTKAK